MKITTLDEARSLGERHFFTGVPCSRGHVSPRFVSSRGCKQCSAENSSKWRKENPERAKEIDRVSKASDKERAAGWIKSWRIKNPEKVAKYNRDYYRNNPNASASRKKWRENNKSRKNELNSIRKMRKKFSMPVDFEERALTESRWEEMYKKCCRMFQLTGHKWHVDHIIPLSKGGRHHYSNFQILPAVLNVRKSSRMIYIEPFSWLADWEEYLEQENAK